MIRFISLFILLCLSSAALAATHSTSNLDIGGHVTKRLELKLMNILATSLQIEHPINGILVAYFGIYNNTYRPYKISVKSTGGGSGLLKQNGNGNGNAYGHCNGNNGNGNGGYKTDCIDYEIRLGTSGPFYQPTAVMTPMYFSSPNPGKEDSIYSYSTPRLPLYVSHGGAKAVTQGLYADSLVFIIESLVD